MPHLKILLCLCVWLCPVVTLANDVVPTSSAAPVPLPVTAATLRAHYAEITAFTASVEQEKSAKFLSRPLRSEIALSMKEGRIDWRMLKPVAASISIDQDGIHMEGGASQGASEAMAAASKDPRAVAFIGFLRALFALDFDAIEKDFALTFEARTLRASPKETSRLGIMIHNIEITFAPSLAIERVIVKTPDETTTLHFRTFIPGTP